ncbi:PREDICTED: protein EIN4 isoform X1 [Theobroma cacao]|uniref:Ethylene receptor n=1 Tax=Theobroma cacao TaxID=3641 RepID=A0AB32V6J0_THECC|nr:PREDICTED: protein EIN4 isoform X1 [Theobroma cacao]XP_017977521.1 PREDICTED: protein EIN4 isoform X1 [Theobroma cacao]
MLRALAQGLLISLFVISVSATDNEFPNCNCDDEGLWSIHSILECQKVSDFLIAVAYFSIPIELLYFISCSSVPFKWVLLQFIAFIVLCGLTHLLNGWTYYGPHSFQLMLSVTIAKFLTALVSCATAITLLTLIPLLLKVKVRELFLRQNVLELDQEVGMMKKKKEASSHVRMLTHEIRKSLDKHTILYTTLVELSKTLDLYNCAVWMPNENGSLMNLTHELKASSSRSFHSIPTNDPDVMEIKESEGVRILRPDSALGLASGSGSDEAGAVAAIRMPMLHGSNFKGGTPESVETCYAILVLVLPSSNQGWSEPEMEIVEVVADQVAVALSHAAVLEESQLMRERLSQQNCVLQQARKNAMMASQARNSFQKVMSHGMKRPMHSILGLLSVFQEEKMNFNQKIVIDTLVKTSSVLSTLINDVMEISAKDNGRFPLDMRPFSLHSMIKEASCLAKCLSVYKGFGFEVGVQSSLPHQVIGDEKRTFQVILHMVGYLLDVNNGGGTVLFRVLSDVSSQDKNDKINAWRSNTQDNYLYLRIEIGIRGGSSQADESVSTKHSSGGRHNDDEIKESLNFNMCKKLVQMMQGNIWVSTNSLGFAQSMTLLLRFQIQPYIQRTTFASVNSTEQPNFNSRFRGLRVLLADDDDINRTVTKKLLEKLGCEVTSVSSGFECLSAVSHAENSFRIVVLDLHMPEMDGFEVAMRIRKYRSHNWPLIIALTASAEDNVRERCLQMGMNAVIQKPVVLQGMADEIQRVLQRAGEGI